MKSLRERRILAGLTQHQLARRTGIDRSKISLVETGQADLTEGETRRVVRFLDRWLQGRAAVIGRVLSDGVPNQAGSERIANENQGRGRDGL